MYKTSEEWPFCSNNSYPKITRGKLFHCLATIAHGTLNVVIVVSLFITHWIMVHGAAAFFNLRKILG